MNELIFGETFCSVVGFEGLYEVSNFGRVFSLQKTRSNPLTGGVSIFKRKELSPVTVNGYHKVSLCRNGVSRGFLIHRIVAMSMIDNPNSLPYVNHIDGNKANNRISNLEWVTPQENDLHAVSIGLKPMGEKHYKTKLSDADVIGIRSSDLSDKKLSDMYAVTQNTINNIRHRVSWKHI